VVQGEGVVGVCKVRRGVSGLISTPHQHLCDERGNYQSSAITFECKKYLVKRTVLQQSLQGEGIHDDIKEWKDTVIPAGDVPLQEMQPVAARAKIYLLGLESASAHELYRACNQRVIHVRRGWL